jgi:hypothetical protein
MNSDIRKAQKDVLKVFSCQAKNFALSGGTALELYYLHHRFSLDLDFFSSEYNICEIDNLVYEFKKNLGQDLKLENELMIQDKAKVRFYTMALQNSERFLKIDFIEDIISVHPNIENFEGVRVYGAEDIYLQKITAITGTRATRDYIGREIIKGRNEARDVFDVYMLSKKIKPLHIFLQKTPDYVQRGIVQWYRRFSRNELKLALLELDIYFDDFNSKEMLIHLEDEIKKFIQEKLK